MEHFSQSQVKEVTEHLDCILSADNNVRKYHEQQLVEKKESQSFPLILLEIIQTSENNQSKQLAAVLLRQMFSNLEFRNSEVWNEYSQEVKDSIKQGILSTIRKERNLVVSKRLGEALVELAVTVLSEEDWDQLVPFLFELVISSENHYIVVGLHVLGGLCTFYHEQMTEHRETLYQVFNRNLRNNDVEVKFAVIETLCSLVEVLDSPDAQYFLTLTDDLFRGVLWLIGNEETKGEEALKSLRDLAETEPGFFKSKMLVVYDFTDQVMKLNTESTGLKYLALDFQVTIAEGLYTKIQENKALGDAICKKVIEMMVNLGTEADETWCCPSEGFEEKDNEDNDVEIDYAKLGRKLLTRMVESVGDYFLLDNLLCLVQSALNQTDDWRMKYAGLMTISELAQFIAEIEKISEIVMVACANSNSSNPKIRYAAYTVIGKLSEDFENEFQADHHHQVIPILLAGINDSVPRVSAQACYSLKLFLENSGTTIATQYSSALLPSILSKTQPRNISLVIQKALGALSSLANACKAQFGEYFAIALESTLQLIKSLSNETHKKLKGQAIECLSFLCQAAGKQTFSKHASEVISLINLIQNTELTQNDPLRAYVLSAWQRIASTLEGDFVPYLPNVIPGLLNTTALQVNASIASEPESNIDIQSLLSGSSKKVTISTADTEDKELAMNTLLTLIDLLKGAYYPYVEQTTQIVYPLLAYKINENVRGTAARICASLVVSIAYSGHPSSREACFAMSHKFLEKLWEVVCEEFDNETLVKQLDSIKTLVEVQGLEFLTVEEVNVLAEKLIKILEASLIKRNRNQQVLADDLEESDSVVQEYNKIEEDHLYIAISDVFGALFKTHKSQSVPTIEFLYKNVLPKFLLPEASQEDKKFGLFIVDDLIEHLGEALPSDKLNELVGLLLKFSVDSSDSIRQAAVYGLGVFAASVSGEAFCLWAQQIIEALQKAVSFPVNKSQKTHGHAKDNAIVALGRVLQHKSPYIDFQTLTGVWVNLLPLRFDKTEAKLMHDLFLDIAVENLHLVLGPNQERLTHIVAFLAEILETRLLYKESEFKVKLVFSKIQEKNPEALSQVWGTLTELQKKKISNLSS